MKNAIFCYGMFKTAITQTCTSEIDITKFGTRKTAAKETETFDNAPGKVAIFKCTVGEVRKFKV
jgi:hypothetical protein